MTMHHATVPIPAEHAKPADEHLGPAEAMELMRDVVGRLFGGAANLEPLGRLKTVADATTKFLVRDRRGLPHAVIIISRLISPHLMLRGHERAEAIRAVIGRRLGEPVIESLATGYAGGRSYVILPWYRDVPTSRLGWAWMRNRLREPVLRWLCEATAAAARVEREVSEDDGYENVLVHLREQRFLSASMRSAVDSAIDRLASGMWTPRYTVDHNDLWRGNLMLRSRRESRSSAFPFVLIDWAGANPQGYGMYDLVRIAHWLRIGAAGLSREIALHADALHCELQDTAGHLLASLGWLHKHIEHFPEKHFIATMEKCWRSYCEAAQHTVRASVQAGRMRSALRRSAARPLQRLLESPAFNRAYVSINGRAGATVLMYHSVAKPDEAWWIDPQNHVPADIFEQQMTFLAKHRRVISLDELVQQVSGGKSPEPNSVVITFDDGYLDNLTVAAPILDRLNLPATIFLPTAYIDRGLNQWIDEAWAAFASRTNDTFTWGGDLGFTCDLRKSDQRQWAYRQVCDSLLTASLAKRERLLAELREALKPRETANQPCLTMNWDDTRRLLADHDCFTIGGHTVTHADLTRCSQSQAQRELVDCRKAIEQQIRHLPRHFSFPYGRFSAELRGLVREAGYDSACGSVDDPLIRAHANCYAIRRVKAPRTLRRLVFLSSSANSGLLHRLGR